MHWRDAEGLSAILHGQLGADGVVEHDVTLIGKSGEGRQCDVVVRTAMGPYSLLIVIECKALSRPVGREVIDGFQSKLTDLRAHVGVLISTSGFTRGTVRLASNLGIKLMHLREAKVADWEALLGPDAWLPFINVLPTQCGCDVKVAGESAVVALAHLDFTLIDASTDVAVSVADFFSTKWSQTQPPPFLGECQMRAGLGPHFLMQSENGVMLRVESMCFSYIVTADLYYLNFAFESGDILESACDDGGRVEHFDSQAVDWREVMKHQVPHPLTAGEYGRLLEQHAVGHAPFFNYADLKRFIRLRVQRTRAAGLE